MLGARDLLPKGLLTGALGIWRIQFCSSGSKEQEHTEGQKEYRSNE